VAKINYGDFKLFSAEGEEKEEKERKHHRQNIISAIVVKYHLYNFRRVVNEIVD
jgi:hypothetical protein